MSDAKIGKPSWNKGKKLSEEHRRKLSEAHMGQVSVMKGKTHTDKTKEKISETRISGNYVPWNKGKKGTYSLPTGRVKSEEERMKISKHRKGITPWNKGKPLSSEHRIKLSMAAVDRCIPRKKRDYRNGKTYDHYCEKFTPGLRRRVRAFFDHKCLLCGMTQQENGELLCVHHVYAEKLACCEAMIEEMDEVRLLFPPGIARFGEPEFSPEEIVRIRMMAPLCRVCHTKTIFWGEKAFEIMKELDSIIMNQYNGKCYFHKEEYKNYIRHQLTLKFFQKTN